MRSNQPITDVEYNVPKGLVLVSKTDMQGTIIECNDAFEAASGFSRKELMGQPHNVVRHPDVPEAVFADMWNTLQMGATWSQVVKNRRSDGGFYWVRANATPVFQDRKIIGYMSVRSSVTEQEKQAASQAYKDISAGKAQIKHGRVIYGFDWSRLNFYPKLNPQYQMTLMVGLLYLLPYLIYAYTIDRGHIEITTIALLGLIPPYLYGLSRLKADRALRANLRRLAANETMRMEFSDPTTYNGKLQSAYKSACLGSVERNEESAYQLDKANQLQSAIDQVSANVMVADSHLDIIYMNKTMMTFMRERETQLKTELPILNVDEIIGSNIDIFHKNPQHNRAMLEQIKEPSIANIVVAGYHLQLNISPVYNRAGLQTSTIVEWLDRTAEHQLIEEVNAAVNAAKEGILNKRIDLTKVSGLTRELSQSLNDMLESIEAPINSAVQVAVALSNGDLTQRVNGDYLGRFAVMQESLNVAVANLSSMMAQTKNTTTQVENGAKTINQGSNELNNRTQDQAASIEETAASMEQMTSAVKQNAENAEQAAQATKSSSLQAQSGVKVMQNAITSMQQINESSRKINDIISLIDSIAFQTNLLALNAAVEAARAGEHGRGFAVVAGEVRNLAGKSSDAAKEIRNLIEDTVQKVAEGTQDVEESGKALNQIVESISNINRIIEEIATSSHEQSEGISQVNQAITNIDSAIQQNAALVEETTTTTLQLGNIAKTMMHNVSKFKLDDNLLSTANGLETQNTGLDFDDARRTHRQWKVKVRAYLNDVNIDLERATAADEKACVLGQWLADSEKQYQSLSSYQTLKKQHTEFHELIGKTLELKDKGEIDEANRKMTRLVEQSDKVIDLMCRFEQDIISASQTKHQELGSLKDAAFSVQQQEHISATKQLELKEQTVQLKSESPQTTQQDWSEF